MEGTRKTIVELAVEQIVEALMDAAFGATCLQNLYADGEEWHTTTPEALIAQAYGGGNEMSEVLVAHLLPLANHALVKAETRGFLVYHDTEAVARNLMIAGHRESARLLRSDVEQMRDAGGTPHAAIGMHGHYYLWWECPIDSRTCTGAEPGKNHLLYQDQRPGK